MFPDLARDDVFRLETARLWLRWPRAADAAAIERYCSRREVAERTARIPHPYPPGSAERFIFAAREGNASGRDLTLVLTPLRDMREVLGAISLEGRAQGRLTLGYALAPEAWGKGLASEAVEAIIDSGSQLDRRGRSRRQQPRRQSRFAPGAGEGGLRLRRLGAGGRAGARRACPLRPLRAVARRLERAPWRPCRAPDRDGSP